MQLKDVIKALDHFAPPALAEKWDNVGLLVEPDIKQVKTVFLTNDLTELVLEEAIRNEAQLIVTYHPAIFVPLKTLCLSKWKERIIVRCLQKQIAVYAPHTSWDAVAGGVNDWLADAFDVSTKRPIKPCEEMNSDVGVGRFCVLSSSISVRESVDRVKRHLDLKFVRLALAKGKTLDSPVKDVALCAGSGGSVLKGTPSDLYLTGEMSHHEVLDACHNGSSVILCEHSNSERGFLKLFAEKLRHDLQGVNIVVSQVDKDPLEVV